MAERTATTQPAIDRAALARLLDEELQGTEAMLQLLEREARALVGDPEDLARLAAEKLELAARLEAMHRSRCDLVEGAGIGPERAGFERLLRTLDDKALSGRWRRLREAVERCREANLSNGAVVELGHRQMRRALEALHGHAPGAGLYDAAGTRERAGAGRVLAKA